MLLFTIYLPSLIWNPLGVFKRSWHDPSEHHIKLCEGRKNVRLNKGIWIYLQFHLYIILGQRTVSFFFYLLSFSMYCYFCYHNRLFCLIFHILLDLQGQHWGKYSMINICTGNWRLRTILFYDDVRQPPSRSDPHRSSTFSFSK